jgi:hypothetical protein
LLYIESKASKIKNKRDLLIRNFQVHYLYYYFNLKFHFTIAVSGYCF